MELPDRRVEGDICCVHLASEMPETASRTFHGRVVVSTVVRVDRRHLNRRCGEWIPQKIRIVHVLLRPHSTDQATVQWHWFGYLHI